MIISGLQKLSLVDWPGKVACTVFTGGCNFRCPFCHNSELLENPPRLMEPAELLRFLEKRRGLLDGVCVSGGEPCLHGDLPQLIRDIRGLGYRVKLDTNGFFPDRLNPSESHPQGAQPKKEQWGGACCPGPAQGA